MHVAMSHVTPPSNHLHPCPSGYVSLSFLSNLASIQTLPFCVWEGPADGGSLLPPSAAVKDSYPGGSGICWNFGAQTLSSTSVARNIPHRNGLCCFLGCSAIGKWPCECRNLVKDLHTPRLAALPTMCATNVQKLDTYTVQLRHHTRSPG